MTAPLPKSVTVCGRKLLPGLSGGFTANGASRGWRWALNVHQQGVAWHGVAIAEHTSGTLSRIQIGTYSGYAELRCCTEALTRVLHRWDAQKWFEREEQ